MQFYKKSKKFVVVTVVIALVLANSVLPVNEKTGQAAEQTPSNPVTDANGKTTWDCVYFGNYLQSSSNPYDGKEPIKWRVLSVNGNDAFLFADKILDNADYDEAYSWDATDTTWEECSLRSWLNDTFLTEAFSVSEQSAIIDTLVSNADNDVAHTIGGGDTIDKVYLLSYAEAMNAAYGFLGNRHDSPTRKMSPTEYAKSRGAIVASGNTIGGWATPEPDQLPDSTGFPSRTPVPDQSVQAPVPTGFPSMTTEPDQLPDSTGFPSMTTEPVRQSLVLFGSTIVEFPSMTTEPVRQSSVLSGSTIGGCSCWWLRSPGKSQKHAAYVSWGGGVVGDGGETYDSNGVRPVLHLDLSSTSWTYAGKVSAWTTEGDSSSGVPASTTAPSSSSGSSGSSSGVPASTTAPSLSSSSSGSSGSGSSSSSNGVKVGDIVTRSNLKYKVLKSSKSQKTVTVVGTNNKTIKKASIPNFIAIDSGIYKVVTISKNAMKGCTKLKTVSIGKKVTEIGKGAFKGCKKLKTITIKSTVLKKIGKGAFDDVKKNVTLKAPKSKKSKYRKLINKSRTTKKSSSSKKNSSSSKKNNSSGSGSSSSSSSGSGSSGGGSSSFPSASKSQQCTYCHGKGTVKCTTCSGTGYWSSSGSTPAHGGIGTGGSWSEQKPCRYCTNGERKCSFCGGKGYR